MLEFFLLALFAGLLVKLVDDLEDAKKSLRILDKGKYVIAAAYGVVIGFIISQASFSMLFLGALIAQLLARKIDNKSHMAGFTLAFAVPLFLGMPQVELVPLLVFIAAAWLDELDLKGKLKPMVDYRLFLKIAALAFIPLGRPDYFIAILAFDLGYLASAFASGRKVIG